MESGKGKRGRGRGRRAVVRTASAPVHEPSKITLPVRPSSLFADPNVVLQSPDTEDIPTILTESPELEARKKAMLLRLSLLMGDNKVKEADDVDDEEEEEETENPTLSQLLKNGFLANGGGAPPNVEDAQAAAQRLAALLSAANNAAAPGNMKIPPHLSLPSGVGLPMPFGPDLLWRYPNPFTQQPPPSPLETHLKAQLPPSLGHDPRQWQREDVSVFMKYCEREFDLERIDMDKFQMNGKALCLLNRSDLNERCSGAGDVIHNTLQMLVREAANAFPVPGSPLTPRPPGLMTPTSPAFPPSAWPLLAGGPAGETNGAQPPVIPGLSNLISQTNSVALSPSPSLDSQSGSSPKHLMEKAGVASGVTSIHHLFPDPSAGQKVKPHHSSANNNNSAAPSPHSESEESAERSPPSSSTLRAPTSRHVSSPRSPAEANGATPTSSTPSTPKEETPELNTNGRLLWDFLQQLLNDAQQRYTSYITWKDKETGVFKIVDPAGLAKLWGIQKNHLSMNYDKMSRALRYYYRVNILRKVQGERHCYQFLRNPSELKSIKNISLLRQQMEAQAAQQKMAAQQAAQAAIRNLVPAAAAGSEPEQGVSPPPTSPGGGHAHLLPLPHHMTSDEPTDLSMGAEEVRRVRLNDRLKREFEAAAAGGGGGSNAGAKKRSGGGGADEREPSPSRARFGAAGANPHFASLIPQVSLKTENY